MNGERIDQDELVLEKWLEKFLEILGSLNARANELWN